MKKIDWNKTRLRKKNDTRSEIRSVESHTTQHTTQHVINEHDCSTNLMYWQTPTHVETQNIWQKLCGSTKACN